MNQKFRTITALNVRSGPGVGYNRLEVLSDGRVVEEVSLVEWCPIAMGSGAVGWVSRKYLVPYEEVPHEPGQVTGEMLLRQAEKHLGQKYVLGANVDLNDPNWIGPWDCAEMVTYDVKQVTLKIYGALNPESRDPEPWTGQWYNDMKAGRVIEIPLEQAFRTPGAILLVFNKNHQHIVFSDGLGATVEAKGKAYGVVRSEARGRGFKHGILLPGVVYKEVI
jgi:hypothetical protein